MASRNITAQFRELRKNQHSSPEVSIDFDFNPSSDPVYFEIFDILKRAESTSESMLSHLKQMQEQELRLIFKETDDDDDDVSIKDERNQLRLHLDQAYKLIQKVKIMPCKHQQEEIIKNNGITRHGKWLSERLRQFHQCTTEYESRKAKLNPKKKNFDDPSIHLLADPLGDTLGDPLRSPLRSPLNSSEEHLDQDLVIELQELDQRSKQRERSILNLWNSIHELLEMSKQLDLLVLQQGEPLNRIDVNVQQTLRHTNRGNAQLVGADDYDHKYKKYTSRCILVLFLLCLIFLILIILKSKNLR